MMYGTLYVLAQANTNISAAAFDAEYGLDGFNKSDSVCAPSTISP